VAKSLEESETLVRLKKIHANTFHLVKKNSEIGPVDTDRDSFAHIKKEEITEVK